jgi:ADP-ribosyl-[dinitrogen reductase] hydrolase
MVADLARGASREGAFRHACTTCRTPQVLGYLEPYHDHDPEPSLDALLATHCALSVFMQSESFADAVVRAVNLGGDADTIGAITGALAGACWGVEAIPTAWYLRLRDHDRILALARELYLVVVEKGG